MGAMPAAHHREPHVHDDVEEREAAILEALRTEGGRVTTGRRAIVRALLTGPDHHVTADDVATAVQADHPDVHRSTVYRTLEVLEQLGVVTRIDLGAPSAVYHLADHAHHHLVCEGCGSVTEVPTALLARLARTLDERYGFAMAGHVAVDGRCATCRGDR
jgi:Fur family ferric uptake transcriptional regulator